MGGNDGDFEFTELEDPLSKNQVIWLMIISQTTATLSIIGSSLILFFISRHARWKAHGVFPRFMLGVSSADIMLSLWVLTAYYCFPKDVGFHFTYGNVATCSFSGALAILGAECTNLYNAGMSCSFLAACVLEWDNDKINKWVEIPTHILGIGFSTIIPIIGLTQNYFNTAIQTRACLFGSEPFGCNDDEDVDCVRGGLDDPFYKSMVFLNFYILIVCTAVGVINTITVTTVATRQLRRGNRGIGRSEVIDDRIRTLRARAFLYGLSQINTTLWSTVTTFNTTAETQDLYPLTIVSYLFFPSQGTLNAIIFFQPSYRRYKKRHPKENFFKIMSRVLTGEKTTSMQKSDERVAMSGEKETTTVHESSMRHGDIQSSPLEVQPPIKGGGGGSTMMQKTMTTSMRTSAASNTQDDDDDDDDDNVIDGDENDGTRMRTTRRTSMPSSPNNSIPQGVSIFLGDDTLIFKPRERPPQRRASCPVGLLDASGSSFRLQDLIEGVDDDEEQQQQSYRQRSSSRLRLDELFGDNVSEEEIVFSAETTRAEGDVALRRSSAPSWSFRNLDIP